MVEGARLESVFRGNSNVGSNPTLSAIFYPSKTPINIDDLQSLLPCTLLCPCADCALPMALIRLKPP